MITTTDDPQTDAPIAVPLIRRIRRPLNNEEALLTADIEQALRRARIQTCELVHTGNHRMPVAARIAFTGASPRDWWANWLTTRITPAGKNSWLAHMVAFHAARREIIVIPRPGQDEAFASDLWTEQALPPIIHIRFSVFHEKTAFSLEIPFCH
jgi:hypothetical protein